MATKGRSISNNKTGEKITWLETSFDTQGKQLVFDFSVSPNGKLPVTHFHPNQAETFEIQKGEFCIKIGNDIKKLKPGDRIMIDKGVAHQWWNPSETQTAEMKVTFEPALNTEVFLEQFFGLGNDNKTKADGTPSFLQIMAMANKYEIYIAGPPLFIQKLMSAVLGGIARLIGYKSYYEKYSSY
jgi:mannose-6-phosphate isomerase-like protein (cupin superfamily)